MSFNELILDPQSEDESSDTEIESDEEYMPEQRSASDSSDSDESVMSVDITQPFFPAPSLPSTSRGSNTRGGTRRGRGRAALRGRVARLQRREEVDRLWSTDDLEEIPEMPPFTGNPGVKVDIEPDASAWEYYKVFVDEAMFTRMIGETNLYASQYIGAVAGGMKPNIIMAKWKDVDIKDMKTFLGLLFLMGIIDKPDLKSFWSTNEMIVTPYFGQCMSRNRFEAILMSFHLNDNANNLPTNHPNYDKLYKIRPLCSHLEERFSAAYEPTRNMAVDESMIPFRGRVAFLQFIPSKPTRYGLKLYLCCESGTSYVSKMELYTGKKKEREEGHGPKVVKRLVNHLSGKGYTVFTDSFFSSVELYETLRKEGTCATGTIRKDRIGLPTQLKEKKLKKGEAVEFKREILLNDNEVTTLHAMKIHDKREVALISTCSVGKREKTGKKNKKTGEDIVLPQMVHQYNQNMNGVDQFDQNVQYFSFNRKTWKWWKRVAFHLLHIAKVQAFLLYKIKNPGTKRTQLDFTMELIKEMTAEAAATGPAAFKRRASDPLKRLTERHFPTKVERPGKNPRPSRLCVVCSERNPDGKGYKKRKETRTECKICDKGLCAERCFELYHTQKKFKADRGEGDAGDD